MHTLYMYMRCYFYFLPFSGDVIMHALDSDIDSENDSEENDELLYDYNGVDSFNEDDEMDTDQEKCMS